VDLLRTSRRGVSSYNSWRKQKVSLRRNQRSSYWVGGYIISVSLLQLEPRCIQNQRFSFTQSSSASRKCSAAASSTPSTPRYLPSTFYFQHPASYRNSRSAGREQDASRRKQDCTDEQGWNVALRRTPDLLSSDAISWAHGERLEGFLAIAAEARVA
jgi:hypothetical protein